MYQSGLMFGVNCSFNTVHVCVSGYCGADIRAVCTEATLCALRRCYPQIYATSQKLLLDVSAITVGSCDFMAAMRKMSPASHRLVASAAKPLSAVVSPLLGATLHEILQALQRLFPHAEQGTKRTREPGEAGLCSCCSPDETSCLSRLTCGPSQI